MSGKEFIALKRAQLFAFEKYVRQVAIHHGRGESEFQLDGENNPTSVSSEMTQDDWEQQLEKFNSNELKY